MTKFNARQFSKYGFVHVTEEDFTDDGNRFQVWQHVESGVKISYSRYTYTDRDSGEKVTEYFIYPREYYGSYGLVYDDVKDEPEFQNQDKFNGCFEVDMEELVNIVVSLREMFLRVKAAADAEVLDMTPVNKRAARELACLNSLMERVQKNVRWWEIDERKFRWIKNDVHCIERDIEQLGKILNGEIDRRRQRLLLNGLKNHGCVMNNLENGTEYSSYNKLNALAGE